MQLEDATDFAEHWVAAWNAHDLDRIMEHYAPQVVFHSPLIAVMIPDGGDAVHGKVALRAYWEAALQRVPDLHFTIKQVLPSSDALTLLFTNHHGRLSAETFVFDADGLVVRSIGAHS